MLTDYHVHLRPDSPRESTTAEKYFTSANAERYRETASERGIAELGVAEHVYRFTQALEVWRHPFWVRWAQTDIDAYCEFVRSETDLKLGIEADYIAGTDKQMGRLLEAREWDYVVGSVHFVTDKAIDMDGEYGIWDGNRGADEIWRRYFETLADAARTGQYDIMAHPDLVKVWGKARPGPDKDPRFYYEPAVEAFLEAGVAAEMSTAGLRKPAGELYPGRAFLEMLVDAGVPIALSSDAHTPEHLGFRYDDAVKELEEVGVKQIAVFENRTRTMHDIG